MVLQSSKEMLKKGVKYAFATLLVAGMLPIAAMAADQAAAPAAAAAPTADPAAAPAAAPAAEIEKGDPNIGRMIFTGERRLTNGGPPCISCHSASVGELGGGMLAPNLTKIYADPTKNPFVSGAWINGGGSPTMGPIFSVKNVTDEEVDQLRAFFQQQSKKDVVPSPTGTFTIIGLAGFIGILVVFNIIWANRYRTRNKGTAHDALWRNYGGKGGR